MNVRYPAQDSSLFRMHKLRGGNPAHYSRGTMHHYLNDWKHSFPSLPSQAVSQHLIVSTCVLQLSRSCSLR